MEGDNYVFRFENGKINFNPLPPHGGRPYFRKRPLRNQQFQSTPSAWRETQNHLRHEYTSCISIHSLRMEGDSKENIVSSPFRKFQSTPSAWRETLLLPFFLFSRSHFNPLPPHGGRPVLTSILRSNPAFQSTPSAWRETSFSIKLSSDLIFQSTPSAWRETDGICNNSCTPSFQSTPSAWRETVG